MRLGGLLLGLLAGAGASAEKLRGRIAVVPLPGVKVEQQNDSYAWVDPRWHLGEPEVSRVEVLPRGFLRL